jgi:hypothetical protein
VIKQERYIERNAGKEVMLAWPGALWIKMRDVGFPDRLAILPGGGMLFIEFKTPTGTLRPAQRAVISTLQRLGVPVYVCTNTREALAACKRHGPAPTPRKRRDPAPKAAASVPETRGRQDRGDA